MADPEIRHSMVTTLLFTGGCVAAELVLGFTLALLLWPDSRFNRVVTILMLAPITVTPIVVGLIFRALLDPTFGLAGYWLVMTHMAPPQGLLGDTLTALPTMMAVDVWEWTPLVMLILLAAAEIPARGHPRRRRDRWRGRGEPAAADHPSHDAARRISRACSASDGCVPHL